MKHKKNVRPDTKKSLGFKQSTKNHDEGQKQNPTCGNVIYNMPESNALLTANSVKNVVNSTTFRNGAEAKRK